LILLPHHYSQNYSSIIPGPLLERLQKLKKEEKTKRISFREEGHKTAQSGED